MPFCVKCGREIPVEATFCRHCATLKIIEDQLKLRIDQKTPDIRIQSVRCPYCGDIFWWGDVSVPHATSVKCMSCGKVLTPPFERLHLKVSGCPYCGAKLEEYPDKYTAFVADNGSHLMIILDCPKCKKVFVIDKNGTIIIQK